ncbi:MAG: hypothetical protein RI988_2721 [Pseudomonadota bacterium]|jgi:putative flippase GtrA
MREPVSPAAVVAAPAVAAVPAPPALHELLRYFLCSALALGVDAGLYGLLMRAAGWGYAAAAAAGFAAGLAVVYMLSVRWAFRTRRLRDARAEFALFAAIGVAGLLLTEWLLWMLIDGFGADALVAKGMSASAVFVFNYAVRKWLLFSRPTEGALHGR